MRAWPALLVGSLLLSTVAAADPLLIRTSLPSPAWLWIHLDGTGEVSVKARVTGEGADHGELVALYRYHDEIGPIGSGVSYHVDQHTWMRAQAGSHVVDAGAPNPFTQAGAGHEVVLEGDLRGIRVLAFSPTNGTLTLEVRRLSGNVTATADDRGHRTFYTTGSDLHAPAQAVVNTPAAMVRGQVEARWEFDVTSTLVGDLGYGDVPLTAGVRSSYLEGPHGRWECPCTLREVRPGLGAGPGHYSYVVALDTSVAAYPGIVVAAADVTTG